MAAGVDEGDDGRMVFGGVPCAEWAVGLAGRIAVIEFEIALDGELLLIEVDHGVYFAGDVEDGFGFGGLEIAFVVQAGDWGDGGDSFGPGAEKAVGEEGAVGMAGNENLVGVGMMFFNKGLQHGVEEMEIAVLIVADGFLPAGAFAFGVDDGFGGEALGIDGDGAGPEGLEGEFARGELRCGTVAMKGEDDGRGSVGVWREIDQCFAGDAVDLPGHFLEFGFVSSGG